MTVRIILLIAAIFTINAQAATKYVNGNWWQGSSFTSQTWYEEEGVLTQEPRSDVSKVIDLDDQYVVPPYGEAHNHNLQEGFLAKQFAEHYIKNGIFYSMMMCVNAHGQEAAREFLETTPLDVAFASACISTSDGHPLRMALQPQSEEASAPKPEEIYDSGYIVMDSPSDIKDKWHLVEAGKPDVVKIILVHHEVEERRDSEQYFGVNGLTADVAKKLVKEIKAHDIRVAAHVESAADFELAVNAGVDIIAHIPGYHWWDGYDSALYELSDAAVKKAAQQSIRVITTANVAELFYDSDTKEFDEAVALQSKNLSKLVNAGVPLLAGSDRFDGSVLDEIEYLNDLSVLPIKDLLNMLVRDTPQAIFPNRKIGRFEEGFEASFVVLQKNPLLNVSALRNITAAIKQGNRLEGFDNSIEQTK